MHLVKALIAFFELLVGIGNSVVVAEEEAVDVVDWEHEGKSLFNDLQPIS